MWLTEVACTERKCITTTWVRKPGGAPEVRSGRHITPSALGTGAGNAIVSSETTKIAQSITVSTRFRDELSFVQGSVQDLVTIATPTCPDWENIILYEGFTVQNGDEKSLFIKFPRADGWLLDDFTQSIVALIELAEVILDCDRLFVCVDRQAKALNSLVHSLMYVGFSICHYHGADQEEEKGGCSPPLASHVMLEYETE